MKTDKRLLHLEHDLAAAQILMNPSVRRIFLKMREAAEGDRRVATAAIAEANRALRIVEVTNPVVSERALYFNAKGFAPDGRKWDLRGDITWEALRTLINCANAGELKRFRECLMCGKWFYAAKPKTQKWCSSKCRQTFNTKTPEAKEKNAAYMRKYRRDQSERADRWAAMSGIRVTRKARKK